LKVEALRAEFPYKGWTTISINKLLKKFRDLGTVDRRQGMGRATQLHHRTGSFQSPHIFPEVNKYAFKKLAVLFIIFFFFSSERIG